MSTSEILPNGATILDTATIKGTEIILAKTHRDYVTWVCREGERGGTYWGHYYGDDEDAARVDFQNRIMERVDAMIAAS